MISVGITALNRQKIEEALKKLAGRLKDSDKMVLVGVPKGAGVYEDGLTIATIAAVNEFGTADGHIPARPFLRPGVEDGAEMYLRLAEKELPDVLSGKHPMDRLLSRLGAVAVGNVQKKIVDGPFEVNAESTIKAKGSSSPLIDTGALRQSINYAIADKGEHIEEGI